MRKRTKLIVAGAGVAAVIAGGAGVAVAAGGDDSTEGPDTPITGTALQRASDVALTETGGGRVTGSEIHDEEGYYEVEVTLDSGRQVDVHLDQNFRVIDSSSDGHSSDEDGG